METKKLHLDDFKVEYRETIQELYMIFLQEGFEPSDDTYEQYASDEHKIYLDNPDTYPWLYTTAKTTQK